MKVKVMQKHLGEGEFPTFKKDTAIKMQQEADSYFLHWHECEIEGHQTFVPDIFVQDGILVRDYNPTELVQNVGDVLEVKEITYAWLLATNGEGITGWIQAEVVVSATLFE